jgi:hypothetical protein
MRTRSRLSDVASTAVGRAHVTVERPRNGAKTRDPGTFAPNRVR